MHLPNKKKTLLKKFEVPLIGSHNIKNSTAAIAVSYFIGISRTTLKNTLKNFILGQLLAKFDNLFSLLFGYLGPRGSAHQLG